MDRQTDERPTEERQSRTTEPQHLVRQPRLGQVHTADGPLDLSAIYVVHHALRRDLRDFIRAASATPVTADDTWAALRRRWAGFTTALRHHTRVEDQWIWPQLEARLDVDDSARTVLSAMPAEHARIEPLLDGVTAAFAAITATADDAARAELMADLDRAAPTVLAHLAHEETAALPLMQRHLSVDRWQAAQKSAGKEYGLSDLRFAVPWSAQEIGSDQFPLAFAHGGILVRLLLTLTRRRYEREHRVAFRYLTPADPG